MPTTKSLTIKTEDNLRRAIKYIVDPKKTNNQTLTSGHKINAVNNAFFEMSLTRDLAENVLGNSNKKADQQVIARHIIQSFDPNDDLTPEEVHEIGRQTVLEFLGDEYEFVIATHVDKDHLHNHIIFNTTSTVDLKKFRWQRGTTAQLRNTSDKVADYHGALILDNKKRNSYTNFQRYRRKNAYRVELKERLNFLLTHSTNWEDFLVKARLLNVSVDPNHQSKEHGQVINYKLLDLPQIKVARDYTLNKKQRLYNKENILDRISKNDPVAVFHSADIAQKYQEQKEEKESLPDLTFVIEPWQIQRDTMTGIYVEVAYGRYETGVVKIPDYRLDQREDGKYEARFNYKDTFYFWNDEEAKKNKFVKGASLAAYLSGESGLLPVRKNSAIQHVREMVAALNILSTRNVEKTEATRILGNEFSGHFEAIKEAKARLSEQLSIANEQLKFTPNDPEKLAKVHALQEEKKSLEKELRNVEKQLKTYDAALGILAEKGFIEPSEFEK